MVCTWPEKNLLCICSNQGKEGILGLTESESGKDLLCIFRRGNQRRPRNFGSWRKFWVSVQLKRGVGHHGTHLGPWSPFPVQCQKFSQLFWDDSMFLWRSIKPQKKNRTTTCIIFITILISVSAIGTDGWMRWPRNSMFKHQTLTHSLGFVTQPSSSSSSWPLRSPRPSLLAPSYFFFFRMRK